MNIRDRIAIRLFWLATAIGCGGIKRMSKTVVDFSSVMGEQMELGRTGGIVIIPWYSDQKGSVLAKAQKTECLRVADDVRLKYDSIIDNPEQLTAYQLAVWQKAVEDSTRTTTEEV